jgi:hypothetical protein
VGGPPFGAPPVGGPPGGGWSPAPPPPEPRRKHGLLIALVAGALALVLLGVGLVLMTGGGDDEETRTTEVDERDDERDDDRSDDTDAPDDTDTPATTAAVETTVAPSGSGVTLLPQNWDDTAITTTIGLREMPIGSCFTLEVVTDQPDTADSTQVDCLTPHLGEVFHLFDADPSVATLDDLRNTAGPICEAEFADYVGTSYADSIFYTFHVTPVEDAWPGDRLVACIIYVPFDAAAGDYTYTVMVGSARDSGQ